MSVIINAQRHPSWGGVRWSLMELRVKNSTTPKTWARQTKRKPGCNLSDERRRAQQEMEQGRTQRKARRALLDRKQLRLITWNVRGLNDARKTRKVIAYLRNHKVDIAILAPNSPMLTSRRLQGQFVAAGYTSHSRGVLIWASKETDIGLSLVAADPGGRYVVARCSV
ncbi:hypothetical protein NDU88_003313 [Pleurodeles waltl]|uniref:Endonuclease/exonuclease/phosphatase domain-containing protein n=1 Tax=Pleurodeles waltl TaxID=8319 RepID=A0AAV7SFE0_PLEWA|nr:hypothetical protein NDU88_003313 [Pleurodeles waltl]